MKKIFSQTVFHISYIHATILFLIIVKKKKKNKKKIKIKK